MSVLLLVILGSLAGVAFGALFQWRRSSRTVDELWEDGVNAINDERVTNSFTGYKIHGWMEQKVVEPENHVPASPERALTELQSKAVDFAKRINDLNCRISYLGTKSRMGELRPRDFGTTSK